MPFYPALKRAPFTDEDRVRVADNLLSLRASLRNNVPRRTASETLLLATWNIRDFDSNKFKHGPRLPESFFYIAEILSAFDVVAIQEVGRNLYPLQRVLRILGPSWSYVVTDVTEGISGNSERMAFVYDRGKVLHRNIVGQVVLPQHHLVGEERQFARTPFYVAFQAGWFKFNLCAVHLYYGADSGEKLERRVQEIEGIAQFFARKAKKAPENYILLGDFNIVSPEHRTRQALVDNGFVIPDELASIPTNQFGTRYYDQIAFMANKDDIQLGASEKNAGAYDLYRTLFKTGDWRTYFDLLPAARRAKWDELPPEDADRQNYFRSIWRTFQMSDHLPLWVELKVDFGDRYLRKLKEG